MPRWLFPERVVLDGDGVPNRFECPKAPADGETIEAGEEVTRRNAPRACGACHPDMTMRVGPPDPGSLPREIA